MKLSGVRLLSQPTVCDTDQDGDGVSEPAVQVTVAVACGKLRAIEAAPDAKTKNSLERALGASFFAEIRASIVGVELDGGAK